jgi:hypothetical protein
MVGLTKGLGCKCCGTCEEFQGGTYEEFFDPRYYELIPTPNNIGANFSLLGVAKPHWEGVRTAHSEPSDGADYNPRRFATPGQLTHLDMNELGLLGYTANLSNNNELAAVSWKMSLSDFRYRFELDFSFADSIMPPRTSTAQFWNVNSVVARFNFDPLRFYRTQDGAWDIQQTTLAPQFRMEKFVVSVFSVGGVPFYTYGTRVWAYGSWTTIANQQDISVRIEPRFEIATVPGPPTSSRYIRSYYSVWVNNIQVADDLYVGQIMQGNFPFTDSRCPNLATWQLLGGTNADTGLWPTDISEQWKTTRFLLQELPL